MHKTNTIPPERLRSKLLPGISLDPDQACSPSDMNFSVFLRVDASAPDGASPDISKGNNLPYLP